MRPLLETGVERLAAALRSAQAPNDVLSDALISSKVIAFLEKLAALGVGNAALLDSSNPQSQELQRLRDQLVESQVDVYRAREHTVHWRTKLPVQRDSRGARMAE